MNRWHWYVARQDELLIDCDSETILQIALKRLQKPAPSLPVHTLAVSDIFVAPSVGEKHFHLAVRLKCGLPVVHRIAWQLYLMDDCYRTVHNLFRSQKKGRAPILLISPHNWLCSGVALNSTKRFWRSSDAVCFCPLPRHKSPNKILECPAHLKLRGE
jgi:hypothetical protein